MRIGFHDRMTVLSGFDAAEREGLTETLQRAAVGAVPGAELTYFDVLGRRVIITHDKVDRAAKSTTRAPSRRASPDVNRLRRPAMIRPGDLGLPEGEPRRRDTRAHRGARAPRNS